jgi:sestrin 2
VPGYVQCTTLCYEKLVSSSLILPRNLKTYLALLASAGTGSQYFTSYFSAKFLEVGGDSSWLTSLPRAPERVQRISGMSRAMLERPWEDPLSGMEGWTRVEQAMVGVVVGMFHAQSMVALGVGAVCEGDVFGGTVWRRQQRREEGVEVERGTFRDELVEKLRLMSNGYGGHANSTDHLWNLHQVMDQDAMLDSRAEDTPLTSTSKPINPIIEDLTRFDLLNSSPTPVPYPLSTSPPQITHVYTWPNTLQTISSLLPDISPNLDRRFRLRPVESFLQSPVREQVDPSEFVDALRAYCLGLIGLVCDSYDYCELREFLPGKLRRFLRKLCLNARELSRENWRDLLSLGFSHAEIVQIIVTATEARFQGVLIYFFRHVARGGV